MQIQTLKDKFGNEISDEETYKHLQNLLDDSALPCKGCNESIFWNGSSKIKLTSKKFTYIGKSYLTTKNVNGNEYNLKYCRSCVEKHYPIKNVHRVFNTCSDLAKFAFNIPDKIANEQNSKYARTLENFQRKYGKEEGQKRFDAYRQKQSYTNSLEYAKSKGWTEEEWHQYNKDRAVTLKNLQRKYGKEEGQKRFDSYCQKQSYTNSLEYYQKTYGKHKGTLKWNKCCRSKAHTLENYIDKFGEEKGKVKFKEYCDSLISPGYSKISQEYFKKLDKHFKDFTTYYATKNFEWKKFLNVNGTNKTIFLDYFIKELNVAVEFNGTLFHGDPKVYEENDYPNPFRKITAKDIWLEDKTRKELLDKTYNIKTFIVWEGREISPKKLAKRIFNYAKRRN